VAGLRVRLWRWFCGWQHRRLVTVRMLHLMFVRLVGWLVLFARSSAWKMDLGERAAGFRFLVRDRAGQFTDAQA
jgi:hypothetical protein